LTLAHVHRGSCRRTARPHHRLPTAYTH
jgi:hypothetical protein